MDWKRSEKLPSKYNSYGKYMAHPIDKIQDCQGEHYRLQLNMYKWILERYYDKRVKAMKVVSTAKNHTQEPFVDNVPHLSDAVDALMAHRRANLPQKHGAPSPNFDLMETPNEALAKDQAPAASMYLAVLSGQ